MDGSRSHENDDDFFHVTCHIDQPMREKIERGEYVDLEKLLPKDKGGLLCNPDEHHLEIVSKDGIAYFAPMQD